jgi:hypothetical protein
VTLALYESFVLNESFIEAAGERATRIELA